MPEFDLPYGETAISVHIPVGGLIGVLEGKPTSSVALAEEFDRAWREPIGIDDPARGFRRGEHVVFVVTDHTRPTPTRRLFPLIWERLQSLLEPQDVTLLVATGTHRPPTERELDRILGGLRRRFRVAIHDCDADLVEVGRSSRGTKVLLNRLVVEADHVVTIGHIGMHYYAGYSGGRKNILPGVAGRQTIETNHAQLCCPSSVACTYHGNPINDEMVEALTFVNVAFIVDVVLGSGGEVAKVVVGEPEAAHEVGRAFWDAHFQVTIEERADVVIASAGGYPKDINLYQAYKGQYNAMRAVRDGGIVLLAAACRDGIGHDVFGDWIQRSGTPEDVFRILEQEGFKLGGHKAVYLAGDRKRAEIHLLSELEDDVARQFFFTPVTDPGETIRAAEHRFGSGSRVLVIPHAADTFPVLKAG